MSNTRLIALILLTTTFVCLVSCDSLTCADEPQKPASKSFALSDAPVIKVDKKKKSRINQVIRELKRGYGGTLVVAAPDPVIDSPEFVAYYVRALAEPDDATVEGLSSYSYRFERLINRHWSSPEVLKDPRLDWDLWRAFLIFEEFSVIFHDDNWGSPLDGVCCNYYCFVPRVFRNNLFFGEW